MMFMSANLPPVCDPEKIVHPVEHFRVYRAGRYRLWYKPEGAPYWCALTCHTGAVAQESYRRLTKANQVRNLLIEQIERSTPPYRAGTYKPRPTYTNRDRKFLTGKGI